MSIDFTLVRRVSKIMSGGGPDVSATEAIALAKDLRSQSKRAQRLIGRISGLGELAKQVRDVPVVVVDRPNWSVGAAHSIESMFTQPDYQTPEIELPFGSGQLSLVLSLIAPRILGQYDPYAGEKGRLLLVAPNIAEFRGAYDLDRRDLCLWVSIHELTHALQFAAAPWLREYIVSRVRWLVEHETGSDVDEVISELTAIMSLLEGHAEYVMNEVPLAYMPSRKHIMRAMARRRKSGNAITRKIRDYVGITEKGKQYSRGRDFTRHVIDEVGLDGFNRIWDDPINTPMPSEISNPDQWIERVLS